ncbi:MAG: serine hydrolase domain-containing protein [Micromonosporaceae bacterium]
MISAQRAVTLHNWMRWPYNRTGFQRVRELIPTAGIDTGGAAPWPLQGLTGTGPGPALASRPLAAGGTLRDLLGDTHTDAFLVLHRGRAVHEEYRHGMGPRIPHLCMSVSKSITATAVGGVIGAGLLSPSDLVTDVVPAFRGTGMDGATVRHVLDMRTGTGEQITTLDLQRAYYATVLWAPAAPDRGDPGENSRSHFWRMRRVRPHGGEFEYRSTLTCVLALLAERATGLRLPDLVSRYLWQPLGAERDAEITVDRDGHALADIGVSCTTRDLARIGEMLRCGGARSDGARVVPAAWVTDTVTPDPDQVAAFTTHGAFYLPAPTAYYRNQWWVMRARAAEHGAIYLGLGIHGQMLLVHEDAEVVVSTFSSWPEPWLDQVAQRKIRGCVDLAESLAAG